MLRTFAMLLSLPLKAWKAYLVYEDALPLLGRCDDCKGEADPSRYLCEPCAFKRSPAYLFPGPWTN